MWERRVAITGLGIVSPLGHDAEAFWRALVAGRSAVVAEGVAGLPSPCAPISDYAQPDVVSPALAPRLGRMTTFAVDAAQRAWTAAGREPAPAEGDRIAVRFGSMFGDMATPADDPFFTHKPSPGGASAWAAAAVGAYGPNATVAAGSASALLAIGEAAAMVARGEVEAALAGGAEASLAPPLVAAYREAGLLATGLPAPRPFDRERGGMVLGEGAAALVLEDFDAARDRGAPILATVEGYGSAGGQVPTSRPAPDAVLAARAMQAAFRLSGRLQSEVDVIFAHGSALPLGDAAEVEAIQRLFGPAAAQPRVTAVKGALGHTLGASGALSTVAAVLALRHGQVPPIANTTHPDPAFSLDFVTEHAAADSMGLALVNSFGVSGHHAALLLASAPRA